MRSDTTASPYLVSTPLRSLTGESSKTAHRVKVSAFGHGPLAISGIITIDILKRFSDEINNGHDYLDLDDLQYVPLDDATVLGQAGTGLVRKCNIVFIKREPETDEEKYFRPVHLRTVERHHVSMLAGNWLITGVLSLVQKQPMELAIAPPVVGYRFLPVISAQAVYVPHPTLAVNGGDVMLVNRAYISSIGEYFLQPAA
jgi:hypothetical protein